MDSPALTKATAWPTAKAAIGSMSICRSSGAHGRRTTSASLASSTPTTTSASRPSHTSSRTPPFRIAATTTGTFTVLGDLGYPVFVGVRGLGASQVAEQVAQYKQAWDDAGHDGAIDVSLRIPVYVGATESDGLNVPEHSFMKQFRRLGSQLAASVSRAGTDPREERAERSSQLAEINWDEVKKEKVAVGTPDMVIEQLSRLRDQLNLAGVVAEFNAGEEIPPDKIESSLRLFCEEVMPALK